ncbi:helix-turn-helix domain-containing protein [Streptomyces sp. AcH 505]|uniref:helix-turn-helix domain-containing protein n=1 Tax=Streptomyces sp. AcH 505 TaxID=352211 RepID=UPI0006948745
MQDEQNKTRDTPALADLRTRLSEAQARRRISKKDLAARSHLGRTTVSEAFQADGPIPSEQTLMALARALRLPAEELLALRRDAVTGGHGTELGRPIAQWHPHDLEVHPAGPGIPGAGALPGYVQRAHDLVLAQAVEDAAAGRSRMLVLVGDSSTGKTRACWEAVQLLAEDGWRLWHPFDPTRAEAALDDLHRVAPRTVVWLNEAQHYLGDAEAGERIAAALHTLLTTPERGPVLVLGTLWPEYADQYTALPPPGHDDRYSRVRELLAGRTLSVPETFDAQAMASAAAKAHDGDQLLADALTRANQHGRLAQDLAGAPELLKRYERATPVARAVLKAAMDARRLGVGLHLPQAFLTAATADYLTDAEYDRLATTKDWAERAYAELAKEVHGKQAPLRSTTPRPQRRPPSPLPPTETHTPTATGPLFRLADYLEQHGRTTRRALCPPASFWHAAFTHLTQPDELAAPADQADSRHRLQWGHHLRHRAADRAADRGDTAALYWLAVKRKRGGDQAGAEDLLRQAADRGSADALVLLAEMREEAGDQTGAEDLARQAADRGDTVALVRLAEKREEAGDQAAADDLLLQAADHGQVLTPVFAARWPDGLDPDGQPTTPWQ